MTHLTRSVFMGMAVIVFLGGCAPGGPMPPLFGPGGSGILLFLLVAAVGCFIWHKLTVISTKLDSLEKEIRNMKGETKGGDHD